VVCRDVDEVHNMMDDIADQQDLSNEISNAISNPIGFGEDMDEDELEKELEALEEEAMEEHLFKVPHPHELPAVPTGEIAKPKPSSEYPVVLVDNLILNGHNYRKSRG
jgi:charged multivesicular body protein 4